MAEFEVGWRIAFSAALIHEGAVDIDTLGDAIAGKRIGRPDYDVGAAARLDGVTVFVGERPASEIPAYLRAAEVLVSPRSRGTNTPLKIYQYLRSGRPIVATRLLTHTQVLSDATAILTEASPESFADGIVAALGDPARAASIGHAARELAETKYSYEAYLERTRRAYDALSQRPAPTADAQAMETADVTLMGNSLLPLPFAIRLSRAAMRTVWTNVGLSLFVKFLVFGLVLVGTGTMWMAVLADVGMSLLVTANGMRLLRWPSMPTAVIAE